MYPVATKQHCNLDSISNSSYPLICRVSLSLSPIHRLNRPTLSFSQRPPLCLSNRCPSPPHPRQHQCRPPQPAAIRHPRLCLNFRRGNMHVRPEQRPQRVGDAIRGESGAEREDIFRACILCGSCEVCGVRRCYRWGF